MRDGLDLSRRTLRRARHRPLRLCAILAGVAAALAAAEGIRPRDVDVSRLRAILREQGAFVGA